MSAVGNKRFPQVNKPQKKTQSPVLFVENSQTTGGSNNGGLQKSSQIANTESDTSSQRSSIGDTSITSRDMLSPPDIISRTPTSENRLTRTPDTMMSTGFLGSHSQPRRQSKSSSSTSLNSDSLEPQYANQEEIINLTREVRHFQEALGAMRGIFNQDEEITESIQSRIQDQLKDLLFILRSTLNRYPALSTQDIQTTSLYLVKQAKGLYNHSDADKSRFFKAVDELALSFSTSVSEYLMGDVEQPYSGSPMLIPTSCVSVPGLNNNTEPSLASDSHLDVTEGRSYSVSSSSKEEVEATLLELDQGVEIALERAKIWSKYSKDLINYVEKRMQYQMEFAKNLAKLSMATKPILKHGQFLPLQSTIICSLDQDVDFMNNCEATCNHIFGQKFVEQLEKRKIEHDKTRKEVRMRWQKMKKEMNDCRSNVDKSKQQYHHRHSEYEKARESAQRVEAESLNTSGGVTSSKVEKRKKSEEEAQLRMKEAETTHKGCIAEAKRKQQDMSNLKKGLITELRESLDHCDQTMKAVTNNYFQLQYMLSATSPGQFNSLCESVKSYEPGSKFSEFVRQYKEPSSTTSTPAELRDNFVFEPYIKSNKPNTRKFSSQSNEWDSRQAFYQKAEAWAPSVFGDDRNSTSGSSNHESSPSASPRNSRPHSKNVISVGAISSGEEDADTEEVSDVTENRMPYMLPSAFKNVILSKAAVTHTIRKLLGPSKCRECEGYLYFNGAECADCGLACHRKCLETLAIQCGKKRMPGKMNVFGVPLLEHLRLTNRKVPFILVKCISVLEEKYINIKGIYRCPGLKIKVEKLCQTFENGGDLVDLSETLPHLITNVIKLYLRQLPEPLLTIKLYPQFIMLARESRENKLELDDPKTVEKLQEIVQQLPPANYLSAKLLITHLNKVTQHEKRNGMTASNLGIVFGPNLLKDAVNDSLSALVEMPNNNRAIELLIYNSKIFGDRSVEENTIPSNGSASPRITVASLNQSANNSKKPKFYTHIKQAEESDGDDASSESEDRSGYLGSGVWVGETSANGEHDLQVPTPPPRRAVSPKSRLKKPQRSTSPGSVVFRTRGDNKVAGNRISAPLPESVLCHKEVERSMSAPVEEASAHPEEGLPGMVNLPTSPSEVMGLKPSPGSKRREPRFV
ncbi:rho GTPase-activating protein 45-like [Anneissia japonica]|uniref:rho GTPase-activating protein 45-like n=1 Tax=Anneissia japonica TaxID=1529436 RepID=UPI0014257EE5|nr:rho GTPase-activating protein 45-like [Anneissia japonica]